jgi:hypothetical protein
MIAHEFKIELGRHGHGNYYYEVLLAASEEKACIMAITYGLSLQVPWPQVSVGSAMSLVSVIDGPVYIYGMSCTAGTALAMVNQADHATQASAPWWSRSRATAPRLLARRCAPVKPLTSKVIPCGLYCRCTSGARR